MSAEVGFARCGPISVVERRRPSSDASMDLQGKELEDAFDDFLQTPILGRKKKKPELDIEAGGEDLEQGKIRVNVEPHQAASRGDASAKMGPSGEAICGGGQSQSMQPQVVWGFCLLRGLPGRPMGDLHVAEIRIIHGKEVAFFGIFDSHNGDAVAKQLQKNLFNNIVNEGGVWSDPAGATRDAYLLTDRHILDSTEKGGSTAVTAMVCELGGRLIVANLGDSRAVLCKNGKAELVSVKHDPTRPVEKANIETRGGHVTRFPGDQLRVDGKLAVTRAFGDKEMKEHISARPDVADIVIDLSCHFLVLGSNGLFSMFDDQEVVDSVKETDDPVKAARQLVEEARRRLCEDDISCIVVKFQEV
uniref:protein-serine/threonine phosphatase n=3 Tax=Physcomitrium patens TaxID=3218 RepID=A0A7I4CVF7_PHYPA